jgi:uncharacterized protein YkwD
MRLRRPLVSLLVAFAVLAALVPGASARSTRSMRAYTSALVQAINGARAANGLAPLHVDWRLATAARGQSAYLAGLGKLDHAGPDGSNVLQRLMRLGFRGHVAGEDLAAGMGPTATVQAWLASPGHRMNLLSPDYRMLGVAVAMGSLGGTSEPFVTADFGG